MWNEKKGYLENVVHNASKAENVMLFVFYVEGKSGTFGEHGKRLIEREECHANVCVLCGMFLVAFTEYCAILCRPGRSTFRGPGVRFLQMGSKNTSTKFAECQSYRESHLLSASLGNDSGCREKSRKLQSQHWLFCRAEQLFRCPGETGTMGCSQ